MTKGGEDDKDEEGGKRRGGKERRITLKEEGKCSWPMAWRVAGLYSSNGSDDGAAAADDTAKLSKGPCSASDGEAVSIM